MQTVFEYNKDKIEKLLNVLKYYKDKSIDKKLDSKFVKNFIRTYGLKSIDIQNGNMKNVEHLLSQLESKLLKKNIYAGPMSGWLRIWNNKTTDNYIKLYCSIDSEHLEKGIPLIMDFMKKNNISHDSKVMNTTRADNVVIRLNENDYINAKKVVDFINGNEYLKSSMNEINPLTPSIGNVGCTTDLEMYNKSRVTFNASLYSMIEEYINTSEIVSVEHFKQFLLSQRTPYFTRSSPLCDNIFDTSLIEKISNAYIKEESIISKKSTLKDNVVNLMNSSFKKLPNMKHKLVEEKKEIKEKSVIVETDIEQLFEKAISVTMVNHGFKHAVEVVSRLLKGDSTGYSLISRNYKDSNGIENYRNLVSNLKFSDINELLSSYKNNPNSAYQYVLDIVNKKQNIINEIYLATQKNHPDYNVVMSLKKYIETGIPTGFTNDNRNLRKNLLTVSKEEVMYFIKSYLVQLGHDISKLDEETILYTYDDTIKNLQNNKTTGVVE